MALVEKNGEMVIEGLVKSSDFIKQVATKDGINRKWNGSWGKLEKLVMDNLHKSTPGTGSVGGDVLLISVPANGFFTNIVKVTPGNAHLVETVFESRREKESEVPIRVIFAQQYEPAAFVNIVIYRADVLAKDNDRSSEAEWEIVSINAQPYKEVPMHPETMKRNASNATGGTYRKYTKKQWEDSEKFWSEHVYLRVKA